MEAKDTVIEYNKAEVPDFLQGILDGALRDQAEISFEAGEKQERERIIQELSDAWDRSAEDIDFVQECKRVWQALKQGKMPE
ncbi:unnamed protein product [marine sediment metagenome]|uniref:Uncharacterized protein n=1 Tax=marine sediment metagenome TaxID=412755 RepID=X1BD54_9ZZZZ